MPPHTTSDDPLLLCYPLGHFQCDFPFEVSIPLTVHHLCLWPPHCFLAIGQWFFSHQISPIRFIQTVAIHKSCFVTHVNFLPQLVGYNRAERIACSMRFLNIIGNHRLTAVRTVRSNLNRGLMFATRAHVNKGFSFRFDIR